jgi:predicted lipid-binding transport protein (Tim44 family)
MNLEPVSKALAAHLSPGGAAAAASRREAERGAVRRMTNGLIGGLVIVLLGVLMLSVLPGKAFRLMGVVAALLGILVAMVGVLSPLRGAARREEKGGAPASLEGAKMTGRLLEEGSSEPASSVADRTTELLGAESNAPKPRRGSGGF